MEKNNRILAGIPFPSSSSSCTLLVLLPVLPPPPAPLRKPAMLAKIGSTDEGLGRLRACNYSNMKKLQVCLVNA